MDKDEHFMKKALAEARKAMEMGEIPVGAVLVAGDKILSRGRNESVSRNDPTAHAEIMAIRKASRRRRNYRLEDCELYVIIEPCAMCLGAAVLARVKRIVFGAPDPKTGAVESVMEFPFEKLNHRPGVKGRVLEEECSRLLRSFFREKRRKKKSVLPVKA